MNFDKFRSLAWTDFFLYAMASPRELYRRISQNDPDPFWISFIVPAIISLFDILAFALISKETWFFYYRLSYGLVLGFLYSVTRIIIYTSLIDMTAQFFKLKGNVRELIPLVNFSMFPQVFLLPLLYPFIITGFAPVFFYVLFSIALFVWYVMVLVQGISEMHSIEFGRSFLIFMLPALVGGIVLFLMLLLIVIIGIGFITG